MAKMDWETSLNELDKAAGNLRTALTNATAKGEEPSEVQQKLDALDAEIAKVKAKAFPEESKPDEKKAEKGKQFPPKPGEEDEEEGKAAKAKAKSEEDKAKSEEDGEKKGETKKADDGAVPWPRDLASKHFREGVKKSDDPVRGWGPDPE